MKQSLDILQYYQLYDYLDINHLMIWASYSIHTRLFLFLFIMANNYTISSWDISILNLFNMRSVNSFMSTAFLFDLSASFKMDSAVILCYLTYFLKSPRFLFARYLMKTFYYLFPGNLLQNISKNSFFEIAPFLSRSKSLKICVISYFL